MLEVVGQCSLQSTIINQFTTPQRRLQLTGRRHETGVIVTQVTTLKEVTVKRTPSGTDPRGNSLITRQSLGAFSNLALKLMIASHREMKNFDISAGFSVHSFSIKADIMISIAYFDDATGPVAHFWK
jgi:hypothetical protein